MSDTDYNKRNATFLVTLFLSFIVIIPGHIIIVAYAEFFTPNIRIDNTGINTSYQVGPSIAVDSQGTLHVVWEDWKNDADGWWENDGGIDGVNNADIYYTNSTDGGITFSPNKKVNINIDPSQQGTPSIAIDNKSIIHVVWTDYRNDADGCLVGGGGIDGVNDADIYYANSTDGGKTWSQGKRINDDAGLVSQGTSFRCIAIDQNDNIHVVWGDTRNIPQGDIYYANSTDGGKTFSENKKINDVSNGSHDPSIAIYNNSVVCVVWTDERDDTTRPDIFFSKSTDCGLSFDANEKVNDDNLPSVVQETPYVATFNGIIGITWSDGRNSGYESIYFANSTDSGESFDDNKRVDDDSTAPSKARPVLAINNNSIGIAWHDKRNGEYDIYFANSNDSGNTFNKNQKVNDDVIVCRHGFPSIAMNNYGCVYIVWTDGRNGNRDIYFSRSNWDPPMTIPIFPPNNSTIINNPPTLLVTPVTDLDNDTVYYNFTISDQPDAESGTVYYSGWITSTSWKSPPLPNGIWYWHTYTSDMWNTTAPNWVWNFTFNATLQSYDIQLYEGWNLISIPFIQINTDLSSVLDSINGSYDAVQWYNADDSSDSWKHHQTSKPSHLNDLECIGHRMGFWIHVTKPGGILLQYSGIIPSENQSITLKQGWNLVGYPSLTNKSRAIALNNLTFDGEIDAIWTYNASSQKWEQIGEFDWFERGRGYYIHAKSKCEWEVPL
jgi:hypothetical protein